MQPHSAGLSQDFSATSATGCTESHALPTQQVPGPPTRQQQLHQQHEQQQQQQQQQQRLQQQQLGTDLIAGMVTSGIYTSLTYPIHRVKILLQTQDANPRIISGKVPRYSFVHSFGRLAREQGILGLWRGNTPYLMRHVPSISMSFAFKVSVYAGKAAAVAHMETQQQRQQKQKHPLQTHGGCARGAARRLPLLQFVAAFQLGSSCSAALEGLRGTVAQLCS